MTGPSPSNAPGEEPLPGAFSQGERGDLVSESFHFWDSSQIDDVDQILLLIESWVKTKMPGLTALEHYAINPWRIMAITDLSLDEIERISSLNNLPSPIKKAACLCYFTARQRPLRHDLPDSGYKELEERVINAKLGFDLACLYLRFSAFARSDGNSIEATAMPRFPSRHFMVEFVQRLAANDLPVGGLCMILELLLYAANPHIAGIIDSAMDDRLKKMVEGYDLTQIYEGLSAMGLEY